MKEKEFLKEHPSLIGKLDYGEFTVCIGYVHETQIDKTKHKEIMDKREHTHNINLECAREGTLLKINKIINKRITKLEKDKKGTLNTENKRRIHPAWKQLNGRIRELKQLKRKLK